MRISIHITSRDRLTEILLLLQSLRTQTYQEFDIFILDDASGTPYQIDHKFNCLIVLLKQEGHYIKVIRNNQSNGVCYARNLLITNDTLNNPLTFRCDDDVILERDYIEKLLKVIDNGYDIATGVVPTILAPVFERETKFVMPVISRIGFNKDGEMDYIGDDLGFQYLEEVILPSHHFRTNALYKSEINKKISYEKGLSPVGFREESFF
ncbi:MAG: glycosyltransferase, partial [Nanoarchaeota archaeon]